MRGQHRSRYVAAAIAAVVVVGGVIYLTGDRQDSGPAAVANDFLEARAAGDCERLVERLSRESWSDGGELTRQGFLDACPGAVDGYQPHTYEEDRVDGDDVQVNGDTATVDFVLGTGADGGMVLEDGDWKVVAEGPFRLGRTPHQTLLGYVGAYTDGDCERLVDFVSEDTWPDPGVSHDEQVAQCTASMPERDQRAEITPNLSEYDDPVDATDEVDFEARLAVLHPETGQYPFTEQLHLVEEQLEWRLDALPGSGGRIGAVASVELARSLLDEPELLGGPPREMEVRDLDAAARIDEIWYEGRDSEEVLRDAGFSSGVWGRFEPPGTDTLHAEIGVWQFATDDGARRYADRLAGLILAENSYGGQEATVPDIDGAHGVVVVTAGGMDDAYVVAVHDRAVIQTQFMAVGDDEPRAPEDDDDLHRAAEIARTQIDALVSASGG